MYIDPENTVEFDVSGLIRKILWRIVPIRRKSIWTKNEADLVDLFKQYFLLDQTTKAEVETFLGNNHILFETSKWTTPLTSSFVNQEFNPADDEIWIMLPGPSIWKGLLPYGSQYHVRFFFAASVLSEIKSTLIVYDF